MMTIGILPNGIHCHQHDDWCTNLDGKIQLRHGFFTAAGGVSSGIYESLNCGYGSADDPTLIDENRRLVARGLGFAPDRLFGLKQYHSAKAVLLPNPSLITAKTRPDADAYVSTQIGCAIAVITADCVPVMFADQLNAVIGVAHAGWRGANIGILESTVKKMCEAGANHTSIEAVIGPAIAKFNYQIGIDCRDVLLSEHPDATDFFDADPAYAKKYHFDLPAFVEWKLRRIGLRHVNDLAIDTYEPKNRLFSHRRATHTQSPDTGRQISVIGFATLDE